MNSVAKEKAMQTSLRQFASIAMTLFLVLWSVLTAQGYAFNEIVPDVRQPGSVSGGSACPVPSHHLTSPAAIAFRWSTMLGTNPKTILTQNQTVTGSPMKSSRSFSNPSASGAASAVPLSPRPP